MSNNLEVILWGTRIGFIHYEPYYPYTTFEYDTAFLKSNIQLSPFYMPLGSKLYNFPFLTDEPFFNLPGLVVESLPTSFGNVIWNNYLLSKGKNLQDLTPIDKLRFLGKRGMGALEYSQKEDKEIDEVIEVNKIASLAHEVLLSTDSTRLLPTSSLEYNILFQNGILASGDTPKILVSYNDETKEIRSGLNTLKKGFTPCLLKFDNTQNGVRDRKQKSIIEYVYYNMAVDAGINMMPSYLIEKDGYYHFCTRRFDRTIDNKKLHMQSLGSLIHKSYVDKYACSYEKASDVLKSLGVYPKDIVELYRRMVFNILTVNEDDNVNNFSCLMDKEGQYRLSPAYDLTFSPSIDDGHKMTINNKRSEFNNIDLIFAGKHMGLKDKECIKIVRQVGEVIKNFAYYAHEYGVTNYNIDLIQDKIKENSSAIWY